MAAAALSGVVWFEYTGKGQAVPKGVTHVRFDTSVVEIEDGGYVSGVFSNNNNLKEVILNEGLKRIGHGAFCFSTSLQSITIPSTVTEIGNNAFNRCSSLREVILNEGLQKIGEFAFSGCTSLQTFTIPTLSTRLNNIIQTRHWRDANNKINEVRGVVERGENELFIPAAAMEDDGEEKDDDEEEDEENSSWETVRQNLDRIINVITVMDTFLQYL